MEINMIDLKKCIKSAIKESFKEMNDEMDQDKVSKIEKDVEMLKALKELQKLFEGA